MAAKVGKVFEAEKEKNGKIWLFEDLCILLQQQRLCQDH
jgi:hypothetical protein